MRIYLGNLREGLEELASEAEQRRLWLATGGPEIGSFVEAVSGAFDDSGLSDDLDTPRADAELGAEAAERLRALDRALGAVDADLDEEALIDSPEMAEVRALAQAALDALPAGG